jgi:hypothetical protein
MAKGPPDPAEPAQACRGGKYLLLLQAMHFFRIKVPTSTAKDAAVTAISFVFRTVSA